MSDELARKLHSLERKTLPHVTDGDTIESISSKSGLQEVEAMRAIQWLENKGLAKIDATDVEMVSLGDNGKEYKKKGLPEKRFLELLSKGSMTMSKMEAHLAKDEISICLGLLRKKNAVDIKKDGELTFTLTAEGKKLLAAKSDEEIFLEKDFPLDAKKLSKQDADVLTELLKRRDIVKKESRTHRLIYLTAEGKKLSRTAMKTDVCDRLTHAMLKDGSWKGKEFRSFDVEINVPEISGGKRHFKNQAVEYIKSIWLDLGFKEMTGDIVHTSFWDLDSLFVPQDHPAREMQDTFYLKTPAKGKLPDKELVSRVKKTHENGWTTGSLGWQSKWDEEKAKENILRTHTTVLSAQTLSKLKKGDLPAKYFAVGKCFRNEALDWKHLFEFYQVEGIVVDEDANFRNLLGYLKNFFRKMGYPDVRIRPGHFPYTEPSAEVDVYHPIRKEWVEIGGSGIFRPEVTKPLMGFETPVLAWGLGLGRTVKEYWDIVDIRDLYKNDLKQLRELKMFLR
jgi:phenylalanyl-tRNA synthetase alpha chain